MHVKAADNPSLPTPRALHHQSDRHRRNHTRTETHHQIAPIPSQTPFVEAGVTLTSASIPHPLRKTLVSLMGRMGWRFGDEGDWD